MVWIKKSVAMLLISAVVSLVPLQTLSQAEPKISYVDWCRQLGSLYAEVEKTEASAPSPLTGSFWITAAGFSMIMIGGLAFEGCYSLDGPWDVLACMDDALTVMYGGLVVMLVGSVWMLVDLFNYQDEMRPIQQRLEELRSRIESLERAGEYRMWFYPCEEE